MRTQLLDFDLPRQLIATQPASPRENSRLLVCSRSDPARLEHRLVSDLPELLETNDRLVFNTTRVLPARLLGKVLDTGGKAEGLFMGEVDSAEGELRWKIMIKARRARAGRRMGLIARDGSMTRIELELMEPIDAEGTGWVVRVVGWGEEPKDTQGILERAGLTPIPPYIRSARKDRNIEHDDAADRAWYQTAMAQAAGGERGSVAAPTAGLHFSSDLLGRLKTRGVDRSEVTLHVGAGTFKPIETEQIEDHPMHAEWCSLLPSGQAALDQAMIPGMPGRVIPVGSTSARTLESFAVAEKRPDWIETNLLITPGYEWRVADGLMTNFHLPRSTLLAMVGSMFGPDESGIERLRELYAVAVEQKYRFYSYGDAMLILP